MTDSRNVPRDRTWTRKQKALAVVVLLLLVVAGELCAIAFRSTSSYIQGQSVAWGRLRCADHGRTWIESDKTATPEGTCH